jgi:hypothetical protein
VSGGTILRVGGDGSRLRGRPKAFLLFVHEAHCRTNRRVESAGNGNMDLDTIPAGWLARDRR